MSGEVIAEQEQKYFCEERLITVNPAVKTILLDGEITDWNGLSAEKIYSLSDVVMRKPNPISQNYFPRMRSSVDLSYQVRIARRYFYRCIFTY